MNNMPSYGSWGYPPPDYRSELMKARASEKRALNINVCLLAGLLLLYNLFNRILVSQGLVFLYAGIVEKANKQS